MFLRCARVFSWQAWTARGSLRYRKDTPVPRFLFLLVLLGLASACLAPIASADTRVTETVGPNGTVSTGEEVSASNPIQAKVKTREGGTVTIEKIDNPQRPGANAEETGDGEGRAEGKDYWGPEIRITPPQGQMVMTLKVVLTVHGPSDLNDSWFHIFGGPRLVGCTNQGDEWDGGERPSPYLPGYAGYRKTIYVRCVPGSDPMGRPLPSKPASFHFFTRRWGVFAETTGPSWGADYKVAKDDLSFARKKRRLGFQITCSLKCERSAQAYISGKSAKALGLKSNKIAAGRSGPDSFKRDPAYYAVLDLTMTRAAKRALAGVRKIKITFEWKAVGPKAGQVIKRSKSAVYSARQQRESEDDLG